MNKDGSKTVECFNSRELLEEGFYYDVYASEAHEMVFREQQIMSIVTLALANDCSSKSCLRINWRCDN